MIHVTLAYISPWNVVLDEVQYNFRGHFKVSPSLWYVVYFFTIIFVSLRGIVCITTGDKNRWEQKGHPC